MNKKNPTFCSKIGLDSHWKDINPILFQLADKESGIIKSGDLKKLLSRGKLNFEEECEEVFKMLDYDKRGYINKPKLKAISQSICIIFSINAKPPAIPIFGSFSK